MLAEEKKEPAEADPVLPSNPEVYLTTDWNSGELNRLENWLSEDE